MGHWEGKVTLRALAATLAAAMTLSACGGVAPGETTASASSSAPTTVPPTSAGPALGSFNNADAAFAAMMGLHHTETLAVTDVLIARGDVDPAIIDLAVAVKESRTAELEQLRVWGAAWGEPVITETAHTGHHGGMSMDGVPSAEMATLEAASAPRAAKFYLTYLAASCEGAIEMAREQVAGGDNTAAVGLATEMVRAQTEELTRIEALLAAERARAES